jgi:hypothetical protein
MVGAVPSSAHVIVRDEPPTICAPAAGDENLTSAMAVAARVASTVKMWQRIVCVLCVLCVLCIFGRAVLRVVGLGKCFGPDLECWPFAGGNAASVWAARLVDAKGGDGDKA